MSNLVVPFSFANAALNRAQFLWNLTTVENFFNGLLDGGNVANDQITTACLADSTLQDENFATNAIDADSYLSLSSLIDHGALGLDSVSPACMLAKLAEIGNIRALRTSGTNTKMVRVVPGRYPSLSSGGMTLNFALYYQDITVSWANSCLNGNPNFTEVPYKVFAKFRPDNASWGIAITAVSVIAHDLTQGGCQFRISSGSESGTLPALTGWVEFTILDLGGF